MYVCVCVHARTHRRGYWLSSKEMDTATRIQILAKAAGIAHNASTLGKSINPTILSPAICK